MDVKFVLPIISIDIKEQTKLEVNLAQIDRFSLPKKHKNGHISEILSKWLSLKSLLFLHFFMNLSETFRIDVNIDFANTNHGGLLKDNHV